MEPFVSHHTSPRNPMSWMLRPPPSSILSQRKTPFYLRRERNSSNSRAFYPHGSSCPSLPALVHRCTWKQSEAIYCIPWVLNHCHYAPDVSDDASDFYWANSEASSYAALPANLDTWTIHVAGRRVKKALSVWKFQPVSFSPWIGGSVSTVEWIAALDWCAPDPEYYRFAILAENCGSWIAPTQCSAPYSW